MSISLGAAAAIVGGAGLLGSALGSRSQRKTNEAQKELAELEFKRNKEMWQMQNKYNSPVEQMSRLRQAGLNPNLVYGSGAVGNTTSNAPNYKAPGLKAYTGYGDDFRNSAMNAISAQNLSEQNKNIQKQNELIGANTELSIQKAAGAKIANQISGIDAGIKQRTISSIESKIRNEAILSQKNLFEKDERINLIKAQTAAQGVITEAKRLGIELTRKQIANMDQIIQITRLKISVAAKDAALAEFGVSMNDNLLLRIISTNLTRAGKWLSSQRGSQNKGVPGRPTRVQNPDGSYRILND